MRVLLTALFEFWDIVRSGFWRLYRPGSIQSVRQCGSGGDQRRLAIFCLFDKKPRPDLRALFGRLSEAGFRVVAVASNDAFKQYEGLFDVVVHVSPVGRDFFAYQQGWRALDALGLKQEAESVCFFNDSVWYFIPHQKAMISDLVANLSAGKLVSGTMIFDEVPHSSGWLFGVPCDERTAPELDKLFSRDFARKSRLYNIRKGEHQIIGALQSVTGAHSLDWEGAALPYAYCYEALKSGGECFYMKGDSTIRTRPSGAQLSVFLKANCLVEEYLPALRWISMTADGIYRNRLRVAELMRYRKHYFK